jgi:hypothetical protein
MNRFARFLGEMCDDCKMCHYARTNPDTLFGKVMDWHGKGAMYGRLGSNWKLINKPRVAGTPLTELSREIPDAFS